LLAPHTSLLYLPVSRAHPYLPSFPTRRSSDLPLAVAVLVAVVDRHAKHGHRRILGAVFHLRVAHHVSGEVNRCHLAAHRGPLLLDRKSTRLNSSHVSISYAVFCLKKKHRQPNI